MLTTATIRSVALGGYGKGCVMYPTIPNLLRPSMLLILAVTGFLVGYRSGKRKTNKKEKEEDYGTPVAPV
jgi:hypothetical protein